jgi:hypothetical protein
MGRLPGVTRELATPIVPYTGSIDNAVVPLIQVAYASPDDA